MSATAKTEESDEIKIVILLTLIGDAGINIFNTLFFKCGLVIILV